VGPLAVTCSVGVAVYDGVMPLEELLHRADAALYHAKREGRNCVCVAQTKIAAGSESGRPAHPGQRRA
jgi:PleD family two-component response regulator